MKLATVLRSLSATLGPSVATFPNGNKNRAQLGEIGQVPRVGKWGKCPVSALREKEGGELQPALPLEGLALW